MKTPSQYPILDNRPIDQWKVTELKEELKRRKLTTKGLKEELVRRLDEAIRIESEAAEEEVSNGVDEPTPEVVTEAAETEQMATETSESVIDVTNAAAEETGGDDNSKTSVQVDIKDGAEQLSQDKSIEEEEELESVSNPSLGVGVLTETDAPFAGAGNKVCESLPSEITLGGEGLQDDKVERDNEDSRAQQDSQDIKPPHEDVKLDTSDPNNQVSEVCTSLGFAIKSNSISTDSVSIFEKNDLKDNIIADNVKLEPDVKHEMVQPSSSNLLTDGGKSHPTDVEEPHENKVSVEETDNSVTNADTSQKNYSADLGSPEKLNLDRSSGDDSMEEDALESKQIDSNNSEEVGQRTEISEGSTMKVESPVGTMSCDLPAEEKGIHHENKDIVDDKRKLPDQEAVNNEPSKRQRRWKSESVKFREQQVSITPPPLTAAKDLPQSASLKRNFSGSDATGANDTPKEREVPPSSNAATNSLRIDRFLRPFTLKAVQELLAKTGTVTSFWMDHIKTHCYVTYSSAEEAVETRNAVYNLQWPPNGGRRLVAEFVDPQEVKVRVEAPPPQPPPPPAAAPPVNTTAPEQPPPPATTTLPSPRHQSLRPQQLPPPPPLPNPTREWAHPPPPPPSHEKVDAPIVTLDDLFRKTKATPRIYYLPLSEEQVSAILEARRKNS